MQAMHLLAPQRRMSLNLPISPVVNRSSWLLMLRDYGQVIKVETQERQCRTLLQKIAAGATLITSTDEVALVGELINCGYVTGAESTTLGVRHFLDVQIMPSGEAHLHSLLALTNPLSKQ